jgi:predicted nucleic acid-binding protein
VTVSPPAIIDTNVVVAGLPTSNAASPVARILDGMLSASFACVISEQLLAEYRAVLVRPQLRKLHGLSLAEVDSLLTEIAQHAIVLSPGNGPAAPDRGDQWLWDLLAVRADLILVTGDKTLLRSSDMKTRVVPPVICLDRH